MTHLFKLLVTKNPKIKIANVFSDGASSQFKQRYLFSNLHEWENDFGFKLVWHFFATSHGKGAVDEIGGTLKRSVWRVVRAGANCPVDAASYAEIATKRNPNTNVVFIPTEDIKSQAEKKTAHWAAALAIPNTQKLHCFRAHNAAQLKVAIISSDESLSLVNIFRQPDDVEKNPYENTSSTVQIAIGD